MERKALDSEDCLTEGEGSLNPSVAAQRCVDSVSVAAEKARNMLLQAMTSAACNDYGALLGRELLNAETDRSSTCLQEDGLLAATLLQARRRRNSRTWTHSILHLLLPPLVVGCSFLVTQFWGRR